MHLRRRFPGLLASACSLLASVGVGLPLALSLTVTTSGCISAYKRSMGGETEKVVSRIYLTDMNVAWQAVLEALKSYRLDVSNREGGYLQTKWQENTTDKNFIDSFGNATAYLKAQMRYRISVAKGFYNGEPSVKVIVRKEQLVKYDVLEGWRQVETDSTEEKTLLYRVGRIIQVKTRMAKLEKRRLELEMEKANQQLGIDSPADDPSAEVSPTDGSGDGAKVDDFNFDDTEVKNPDESLEDFDL
jgi:hypothetical protein